jgi:hypothetical protein
MLFKFRRVDGIPLPSPAIIIALQKVFVGKDFCGDIRPPPPVSVRADYADFYF